MNYIILITVIVSLIVVLKSARTIIKAAKRINLLYDYFIINGSVSSKELQDMVDSLKSSRPDPNDDSGCPKESELLNEN